MARGVSGRCGCSDSMGKNEGQGESSEAVETALGASADVGRVGRGGARTQGRRSGWTHAGHS